MSIAEIERFAADLQSNAALRAESEKAEAGMAPETPLANAIVFAATKGYAFTADDMKEYVKARAHAAGRELTDAELGGIVGGTGQSDMMDMMMDMMKNMPARSPAEERADTGRQIDASMAGASAAADRARNAASVSLTMGIVSAMTAIGSGSLASLGGGAGSSVYKKG